MFSDLSLLRMTLLLQIILHQGLAEQYVLFLVRRPQLQEVQHAIVATLSDNDLEYHVLVLARFQAVNERSPSTCSDWPKFPAKISAFACDFFLR